jgi:hypothetical protein
MHLTKKLDGKYKFAMKVDNPFPVDYCPLTDLSDPLDAKVYIILSAPHWGYEMDSGTWMDRYCDQDIYVVLLSGIPT